jgi:putative peptide zinc metalloprotease protein
MAAPNRLFHESWHRIAEQKIGLRSTVRVQRQMFRGERWYVVQDPFTNQFYRLRPATWAFVARLNRVRTVDQAWKETLRRDPDTAPGQGDVIELLAQLYHANLLHYSLPPDSARLFERYRKRKQRELKASLSNIMFFRVPLFDPDALLKALMPLIKIIIGPIGALLWLAMVGFGIKLAIDNSASLLVQTQGILAPSNLALLYLGMVIIKSLHEFGHAFAVRRFGGEVHTMGVMFLIFNPLPYMDATAAWAFRNKWKRVFVGASGMIFEVFVAACAMIVWAHTGSGILNSLAYNMMFIASVSTIVFNINPLLRFDGYYILSDLLDIPNLHQQARQHLVYLVERFAFGCKKAETPATTGKEGTLLALFGVLSSLYRVVVFTGILLFVADRFLLAGIIMALVCVMSWLIVPSVKLVRYLASSPRLERVRMRAAAVSLGTAAAVVALLYFCPAPVNFKAPGVLKAKQYSIVASEVQGAVREVIAPSGSRVAPGDPLVRFVNPELEWKIEEAEAALRENRTRFQRAMQERQADMKPITSRIDFFEKQLERLREQREALVLRSAMHGVWVSPNLEDLVGMWLPRGTPMGQLVNDSLFLFVSVVSQEDGSRLFEDEILNTTVRIRGQADTELAVAAYTSIPMEQTDLPSSSLGWAGGGDIAVKTDDRQGTTSAEPFYEVRALLRESDAPNLLHGRSGKIKFDLPMKPLLHQWSRKLRQIIQKRYHI